MRGHRSICLPDFQGCRNRASLITYLASMWKGLGYRVFRNTGHPAEIAAAKRAAEWVMTREPGRTGRDTGRLLKHMAKSRANTRITASFEYTGTPLPYADACCCLNSWARAAS